MGRNLSTLSTLANYHVVKLLDIVTDDSSFLDVYQKVMQELGSHFGDIIAGNITDKNSNLSLACTVEDADFLAKGILDKLERHFNYVSFSCFWNRIFSPFDDNELEVSPIIRQYQEPKNGEIDYLVVIESISSSSCVIRTNLTNLLQELNPKQIFIVAPVMYYKVKENLRKSFEETIYNKFIFLYFALDDERPSQRECIPGITSSVYKKLYTPKIVKTRRANLISRRS
jgi:hypothetical protein